MDFKQYKAYGVRVRAPLTTLSLLNPMVLLCMHRYSASGAVFPHSLCDFVCRPSFSVLNMLICLYVNFLQLSCKLQLCDSLAFANFILQRIIPYRVCDFFDEVCIRILYIRTYSVSIAYMYI